jgi:hypothetical protein
MDDLVGEFDDQRLMSSAGESDRCRFGSVHVGLDGAGGGGVRSVEHVGRDVANEVVGATGQDGADGFARLVYGEKLTAGD